MFRTYKVDLRLDGSLEHVLANKIVTVPEIAVLKRLHGDGSVYNIRPNKGPKGVEILLKDDETGETITLVEHRERLKKAYDRNERPIVDALFGPHGKLPATLAEIGIDPAAEAKALREAAKAAEVAAKALEDESAEDSIENMLDEKAA